MPICRCCSEPAPDERQRTAASSGDSHRPTLSSSPGERRWRHGRGKLCRSRHTPATPVTAQRQDQPERGACPGGSSRPWRGNRPDGSGARLTDAETMLARARSVTWKGTHRVVQASRTTHARGVTLTGHVIPSVESRREGHPSLAEWDILIRAACRACPFPLIAEREV